MNPFILLDSLLTDYLSPAHRRLVHTLLALVSAVVGVYLAVDGMGLPAIIAFVGTLYAAANHANTSGLPGVTNALEDNIPDDNRTYAEAGGQPYYVELDSEGHSIPASDGLRSKPDDPDYMKVRLVSGN